MPYHDWNKDKLKRRHIQVLLKFCQSSVEAKNRSMFAFQTFGVLIIQIIIFKQTYSILEPIGYDKYESIAICTLEIAIQYFDYMPNLNIFSINSSRDYDLLSVLYHTTNLGKKLKSFATFKVDFYEEFKRYSVIAINDLSEIVENQKQIKKLLLWNSRSRYIFVTRQNSIEYLDAAIDILWYNYIINAVILMPSKTNKKIIEIYSWFPFENGLCGRGFKARLVDTCEYGIFNESVDLYPNKVPHIFNGCHVRAQVIVAPPYVMPPDDGNIVEGQPLNITNGIEILLMQTIAQLSNFTLLVMSSTTPNDWGLASEDGNTSGTIKILFEKNAELGFGSYGPTAERRMYCDNSASHTYEGVSWCVPKAQIAPRWRNLLDTFQYSAWIAMIVGYLVVSFIAWTFCYLPPRDTTSYAALKNCYKHFFSIFLAISTFETPKKASGRIMFFVWIVFGLHFVAAYQAKLITVLLHPNYERQMDTLDEILTSGIEWASLPTLKRFFNNTDDWRVAKINKEWNTEQSALNGLRRIAYKRDYAFCLLTNNAHYEILKLVAPDLEPLVYCLPGYLTYPSEIYMTKGFPLKDRIDQLIYRIKATGLMSKWQNDIAYYVKLTNSRYVSDDNQKLTISHLQGAFMVLGIGLGCSILSLICEFIFVFIRRRTIRKKVFYQWRQFAVNSSKTRSKVKSIKVIKNNFLPFKD